MEKFNYNSVPNAIISKSMDILNDKHFNNFSNSLFDQSIKSKVKGR